MNSSVKTCLILCYVYEFTINQASNLISLTNIQTIIFVVFDAYWLYKTIKCFIYVMRSSSSPVRRGKNVTKKL